MLRRCCAELRTEAAKCWGAGSAMIIDSLGTPTAQQSSQARDKEDWQEHCAHVHAGGGRSVRISRAELTDEAS